jgi:transcription-repair coupling factor (superfamily II helicase)
MHLNALFDLLYEATPYVALRQALQSPERPPLPDQRVLRAARPFVTAAVTHDLNRPTLIVTGSVERAYNIAEQLPVWLPNRPILRFAEPGAIFYERTPWSDTAIRSRLGVLAALCPPVGINTSDHLTPAPVIVSSALAMMQRTLPIREFKSHSRVVKQGATQDPDKLLRFWLSIGYTPQSVVTQPGTFSRRGGIVDIFPIAASHPYRMEFFGDEIESIRPFDPQTQRSATPVERVVITPAREALPKYGSAVAETLTAWFAAQPASESDVMSALPDEVDLRAETAFPHLEFYLPLLHEGESVSLLDYLPAQSLVIIEDWATITEAINDLETQSVARHREKYGASQLPATYPLPYLTWDDLKDSIEDHRSLHLGGRLVEDEEADSEESALERLGDLFSPGHHYGGQLKIFLETLRTQAKEGQRAVVVTRQAVRLYELWREQLRDKRAALVESLYTLPVSGELDFIEGGLAEGWVLGGSQKAFQLLTDAEIFGWKRPEPRRRQGPKVGQPDSRVADLEVGDYVVHTEYGIGRFTGLHRREVGGSDREYFVIQFAGSDTLYVPIHQVDRLTRYVGTTDAPPQLHKIGTGDWAKAKEAARIAAEQVARELLELYAIRSQVVGHAFASDTPWQHELEASFPYIETEDQLRALREVKADMERPQPMDRLICGDVGYGKTEIALRAAFKAVMEGKQVAILVPTTVLAQQHYTTFSERLTTFPIKVDVISRFRTKSEQDAIIDRLREGKIDILIGTHRLIQSDIRFADLGLLVIDEEQRFGVTHKEKLKQMRTEVDVLTLTATPIPRTLYMGLTGLRDISLLQTPPAERLPVLTHVGPYDERLVRQAILRELDRDGQIFFVHNRVATIDAIHRRLTKLIPEARVIIGHGQMAEGELEEVMSIFASGGADILLCTTIIESGLDIPNANTIIVDRADMFGLAVLHQLRGRVGRSINRAYAYFFHPAQERLNDDARARLETIAEHTELGAGMSIAMRDLEIRGAGDLLGAKQSGYIASVGFHLYTQLFAQAVQRLKWGQPIAAPNVLPTAPSIPIDLPVSAYVPTDFIPDMSLRMQLYRRIAEVASQDQIDQIEGELADRFGALPPPVSGLLFQLRVKLLAFQASATHVTAEDSQISVRLPYLAEVDRAGLQAYLGEGTKVSRVAVWIPRTEEDGVWQLRLLRILGKLAVNVPTPQQRERVG